MGMNSGVLGTELIFTPSCSRWSQIGENWARHCTGRIPACDALVYRRGGYSPTKSLLLLSSPTMEHCSSSDTLLFWKPFGRNKSFPAGFSAVSHFSWNVKDTSKHQHFFFCTYSLSRQCFRELEMLKWSLAPEGDRPVGLCQRTKLCTRGWSALPEHLQQGSRQFCGYFFGWSRKI